MRTARNLGALLVLAFMATVVLIGLSSPQVADISRPLGQAGAATGRTWRDRLPSLGLHHIAGNQLLAAAVGLALFALLMLLVPAAHGSGRGRTLAAVGSAVVAFVLYQPGLLGGGS